MNVFVKSINKATQLRYTMDILMGRAPVTAIANRINRSRSYVKYFMREVTPIKHIPNRNQIVIYKDLDSIYMDNNQAALALGLEHNKTNLVGCSDKDLAPEYAENYVEYDRKVIQACRSMQFQDEIIHTDIGTADAIAEISPVLDTTGNCSGVIVVGSIKANLTNITYEKILKYFSSGLIKHLINKNNYVIKIHSKEILLYQKEMECLLYLSIGMRPQKISEKMEISKVTVDKCIERIKYKLNIYHTNDILECIIQNNILAQLNESIEINLS